MKEGLGILRNVETGNFFSTEVRKICKKQQKSFTEEDFEKNCQFKKSTWNLPEGFLLEVYAKMELPIKPDSYFHLKYLGTKT